MAPEQDGLRREPHATAQGQAYRDPGEQDLDSDEIRSEIRQTRHEMDDTLNRLGDKMRPRHLLDDVLDWWQTSGRSKVGSGASDTVHSLGKSLLHQARENPVPSLLIGAGLAWIVFSGNETERDLEAADFEPVDTFCQDRTPGRAKRAREKGRQLRDQAGALAGAASETISETAHSVADASHRAGERVSHVAATARRGAEHGVESLHRGWTNSVRGIQSGGETVYHRFEEASEDYPLAVGMGFLAAGVLAGLALPSTRREDEVLGPLSDDVKQRVGHTAEAWAERAEQVAQATVEAVQEKAEEEGLTPHALKEKVGHVADEARHAASETAHEEGVAPDQLRDKAKEVVEHAQQTATREGRQQTEQATEQGREEVEALTETWRRSPR